MQRRMLLPSARALALSRSARSARWASSVPPSNPSPPSSSRPDEETVRKLAESARFQQKMWDTFVPERSVKFGDQRFWVLFGIVGMLYTINTIRDARKGPEDPDLPAGAARRLPDGRLLMLDGSISARGTEVNSPHAPSLHKVKTPEEEHKGVINNMVRRVKDAA